MRKTSLVLLGAVAGAALTLMAVQSSRLMVATSASAASGADTYRQLNLLTDHGAILHAVWPLDSGQGHFARHRGAAGCPGGNPGAGSRDPG
jgi:hypothetical protein